MHPAKRIAFPQFAKRIFPIKIKTIKNHSSVHKNYSHLNLELKYTMCYGNHTLIKKKESLRSRRVVAVRPWAKRPWNVMVWHSRCGQFLKQCYRVKYMYCGWQKNVTAVQKGKVYSVLRIKSNYLSWLPYASLELIGLMWISQLAGVLFRLTSEPIVNQEWL